MAWDCEDLSPIMHLQGSLCGTKEVPWHGV